jgi:hypothetical protein
MIDNLAILLKASWGVFSDFFKTIPSAKMLFKKLVKRKGWIVLGVVGSLW